MGVFRTVKGEAQKGMFWVAANSDWARRDATRPLRTQLKSYLNASYGSMDKKTAALMSGPPLGFMSKSRSHCP